MNSKTTRELRKQAREQATEPYGTTNINVQVKQMKSGEIVVNDKGAMVEEVVPVVTYTTVLKADCARKIYKELKKEYLCQI